jgi:hypothetical protein
MSRLARRMAMLLELGPILLVLPGVEAGRRRRGPGPLLAELRRKGRRSRERDPAARARLQRAIGWVDQQFPGGANCYRRALLEIALDRGAAAEPLRMGFRVQREGEPGHAWLGNRGGHAEDYDAVVDL